MNQKRSSTFHAFTIKHDGYVRRIISELVVFSAFDPAEPQSGPQPNFKTTALWDTGATMSVITPKVVAGLGLTPVGKARVNHAGGVDENLTYVVNLGLPNRVLIAGVMVAECPIEDSFGAIIGMDVIASGDFAITNTNGQTCMSFRYPSIAMIDYVVDANRQVFAGTNRNAPCPCGKRDVRGKPLKYKDCHGSSA